MKTNVAENSTTETNRKILLAEMGFHSILEEELLKKVVKNEGGLQQKM